MLAEFDGLDVILLFVSENELAVQVNADPGDALRSLPRNLPQSTGGRTERVLRFF